MGFHPAKPFRSGSLERERSRKMSAASEEAILHPSLWFFDNLLTLGHDLSMFVSALEPRGYYRDAVQTPLQILSRSCLSRIPKSPQANPVLSDSQMSSLGLQLSPPKSGH